MTHATAALVLVAFLGSAPRGVRWTGDSEAFTKDCPEMCTRRPFVLERAGAGPVASSLVMSQLDPAAARYQYIVLGRYYRWWRLTGEVQFSGQASPASIKDERANMARVVDGTGQVIGRAANPLEAGDIALAHAVDAELEAAASAARASARSSTASGGREDRSGFDAAAHSRMVEEKMAAYRQEETRRHQLSAERCLERGDLDGARLQARFGLAVERTPELTALESRVAALIAERDKAQAKKAEEERAAKAALEASKPKPTPKAKPDPKVLFAGNVDNKPYPNPYDTRDPARPVAVNPTSWADCPQKLTWVQLKEEYTQALVRHDGYRLHQLLHDLYHQGKDIASQQQVFGQIYEIASYNRDPWLMMDLARTLHSWGASASTLVPKPTAFYFQEVYRLAVLRADPAPLEELYLWEKDYDLLPDLTADDVAKVAYQLRQ